ncbi:MAG: hypothetical protein FD138_4444 [Planctomycetota bacterium]|nr:MAG: hypothetical protein FD138_4444 [Planctomycetota bacterium]
MTICPMTTWPCRLLMLALLCVVSVGCGGPRGQPVNPTTAKEVLKTYLQAWQDGKKAEDLKPGIIGADREWSAGKKLVAFEILTEEANQGTRLSLSVNLTLKDDKGTESKSTVKYAVSTAPAVTVLRDED